MRSFADFGQTSLRRFHKATALSDLAKLKPNIATEDKTSTQISGHLGNLNINSKTLGEPLASAVGF